jgi:hypothetical protein
MSIQNTRNLVIHTTYDTLHQNTHTSSNINQNFPYLSVILSLPLLHTSFLLYPHLASSHLFISPSHLSLTLQIPFTSHPPLHFASIPSLTQYLPRLYLNPSLTLFSPPFSSPSLPLHIPSSSSLRSRPLHNRNLCSSVNAVDRIVSIYSHNPIFSNFRAVMR